MRDVHEARLLIVDDEPELRRMLVSILRGDGYADVHEAATAAEAMEKALRLWPDALVSSLRSSERMGRVAIYRPD